MSVEEHRKYGGDTTVDVAYKYLTFFLDDDAKLQQIKEVGCAILDSIHNVHKLLGSCDRMCIVYTGLCTCVCVGGGCLGGGTTCTTTVFFRL